MKEMKELKAAIKRAADEELIRANKVHVPKFVDAEHRFGAIYGELDEVHGEIECLDAEFAYYKLQELNTRDMANVVESLDRMRLTALALAAEATQLVAMCEKGLCGIYQDKGIEDCFKEPAND